MKICTYMAALLLAFTACHQNPEQPDGGPCQYDQLNLRATLIRLDSLDQNQYDALFLVERVKGKKDSILYSSMNNHHYIQSAVLPADSLEIGKDYQYLQQTIRSGACSPNADLLFLKPYAE